MIRDNRVLLDSEQALIFEPAEGSAQKGRKEIGNENPLRKAYKW